MERCTCGGFVPLCTARLRAGLSQADGYPLASSASCGQKLLLSAGACCAGTVTVSNGAPVITQCSYWIENDLLRLFVEQLYSTNSGFYKWGLVSVVINQITCFALYFQHIQFVPQ